MCLGLSFELVTVVLIQGFNLFVFLRSVAEIKLADRDSDAQTSKKNPEPVNICAIFVKHWSDSISRTSQVRTFKLVKDRPCPAFGLAKQTGELSTWEPHWGVKPDCGPLNMKLDPCTDSLLVRRVNSHVYPLHSELGFRNWKSAWTKCSSIQCPSQVPPRNLKKALECSSTKKLQTRAVVKDAFGTIRSLFLMIV